MVGKDLGVRRADSFSGVASVEPHPVHRGQAPVCHIPDERVMEAVAARRGVEVDSLGETLERAGDGDRIAVRE
jgi:hypothetical protein